MRVARRCCQALVPKKRLHVTQVGSALVEKELGRGLLTGAIKSGAELQDSDSRKQRFPRFEGENFDKTLKAVETIENVAKRHQAEVDTNFFGAMSSLSPCCGVRPCIRGSRVIRKSASDSEKTRLNGANANVSDVHCTIWFATI